MKHWCWLINLIKWPTVILYSVGIFSQKPPPSFYTFKENYVGSIRHSLADSVHRFSPNFFTWKEKYVVKTKLIPLKKPQITALSQSDSSLQEYIIWGYAQFDIKGMTRQLTIYQDVKHLHNPLLRSMLFIPFTDLTNGRRTYQGGRYLQFRVIDTLTNVWINFNEAINPLCVYKPVRCPLVPPVNHIPVAIKAGEKRPKKVH